MYYRRLFNLNLEDFAYDNQVITAALLFLALVYWSHFVVVLRFIVKFVPRLEHLGNSSLAIR